MQPLRGYVYKNTCKKCIAKYCCLATMLCLGDFSYRYIMMECLIWDASELHGSFIQQVVSNKREQVNIWLESYRSSMNQKGIKAIMLQEASKQELFRLQNKGMTFRKRNPITAEVSILLHFSSFPIWNRMNSE